MSKRTNALAERLEEGAGALANFASALTGVKSSPIHSPVSTRCDPASSASPISRSIRSLVAPTPLGSATRDPKRSPEKAFVAATSARSPGVGFCVRSRPARRHHSPSLS